jgi:hypothetical protein
MSRTRGEIAFTSDGVLMSDDGRPLVCHDNSPNRPRDQSAANRAHLCLCWNTHEELLGALHGAKALLQFHGLDESNAILASVLAAIARATGGAE